MLSDSTLSLIFESAKDFTDKVLPAKIFLFFTLVGAVDPAKLQKKKIRKVRLFTIVTVMSLSSNDRGSMKVAVKEMLKMDTRNQRRRVRRRTRIKKR